MERRPLSSDKEGPLAEIGIQGRRIGKMRKNEMKALLQQDEASMISCSSGLTCYISFYDYISFKRE